MKGDLRIVKLERIINRVESRLSPVINEMKECDCNWFYYNREGQRELAEEEFWKRIECSWMIDKYRNRYGKFYRALRIERVKKIMRDLYDSFVNVGDPNPVLYPVSEKE